MMMMGSLEEETLMQMVHDFIESDSSTANFRASSKVFPVTGHHTTIITPLQEVLVDMSKAENKVLESVSRHMRSKMTAEKSSNLKKWLVMQLKMDGLRASLRRTAWVTSFGCPAGDYEYIEVALRQVNGETIKLIVDIDFRSQFELARPTPSYKRLTDAIPSVFVGTEHKLNKIISLLCAAAKQSLQERGLHVPPWRTTTYMQCKWLSRSSETTTGANSDKTASGGGGDSDHRHGFWLPPVVKPRRGDFRGGSALSSQFSSMGINCC